jgi:hypothetical protein
MVDMARPPEALHVVERYRCSIMPQEGFERDAKAYTECRSRMLGKYLQLHHGRTRTFHDAVVRPMT